MDERSYEVLVSALIDQQYLYYLLLKLLVEKGVLSSGEAAARYDQKERYQFGHDLLDQLVSTGLKIPAWSPSTSQKEPSSARQDEAKAETDPESGTKS